MKYIIKERKKERKKGQVWCPTSDLTPEVWRLRRTVVQPTGTDKLLECTRLCVLSALLICALSYRANNRDGRSEKVCFEMSQFEKQFGIPGTFPEKLKSYLNFGAIMISLSQHFVTKSWG